MYRYFSSILFLNATLCAGISRKRKRVQVSVDDLLSRLGEIESTPLPPRYPKKEFKPDNPEIEILEDYSKVPKKSF